MNRIEFMTELAALLQDVPQEERKEAMKYYNDYFDDAGADNEQQVIQELGSPQKVAATIKADLNIRTEEAGQYGEYRETGYTDTRYESREMPADKQGYAEDIQQAPRTSRAVKILLIILIIIFGGPVIVPTAIGIVGLIFGGIVALFGLFLTLVIAAVAIAIVGVILFCVGIATLMPEFAVGLAMIGIGLLLGVVGVIGTVAGIKLCMVVFPGICRGLVWICRKPFHRKAVV